MGCLADVQDRRDGMLESSKLATGYAEGPRSRDHGELNGPEGSLIYELEHPLSLIGARRGGLLAKSPCPVNS